MRAFLAIELSPDVRESVAAIQDEWTSTVRSAKWVRPENLHLTLRFLGKTDADVAAALGETLGAAAGEIRPFAYSLRGGGCFPNVKRARVLWVGVDPVPDEMVRLHDATENAVEQHGFEPERRRFKPHLTIARFKTPEPGLADVVTALDGRNFGDTHVGELILFESRLSPRGASYHVIERFPLGGTQRKQLV